MSQHTLYPTSVTNIDITIISSYFKNDFFLIQGTRTVERRLKNYISSRKRQNGFQKGEHGVWRAIGAPQGTIGTEQGQMEALWSHVHALSRDFKLSDLIGRLLLIGY